MLNIDKTKIYKITGSNSMNITLNGLICIEYFVSHSTSCSPKGYN